MAKSEKNIGWVSRQDGEIDRRYTMPQVVNTDGSRDMRYNSFHSPVFGPSEPLTTGYSKYYESSNASHQPGVYQIMTVPDVGRPTIRYTGMTNDTYRRINEHGRGEPDNIASFMSQAWNRGIDTRARYAAASSEMEARAQERYLLSQRNFDWNSNDNDGANRRWYH